MVTPRKQGRRNRRGTVSKLASGKYQARTPYFPDATGKPVRKSFTAETKTAAEDQLDAWVRERGGNPAGESLTVADVLDGFLARYEKRVKADRSPKTMEQYR